MDDLPHDVWRAHILPSVLAYRADVFSWLILHETCATLRDLPRDVWVHHIWPLLIEHRIDVLLFLILRETCATLRDLVDHILTPRFITDTLRDPRYDKKLDLTKHPSHFPPPGIAPLIHHFKKTNSRRAETQYWIRSYFRHHFCHQDANVLLWFADRNWPLGFLIDEQYPISYACMYDNMMKVLLSHYARRTRSYVARSFLDGWTRHVLETQRARYLPGPVYPAVTDNQGRNIWWNVEHGGSMYYGDPRQWNPARRYPTFKQTRKEISDTHKK